MGVGYSKMQDVAVSLLDAVRTGKSTHIAIEITKP